MGKIQNISLKAIATRRFMTTKKIVNVKNIDTRLPLSKPLTRISLMLTKKQQPANPNAESKSAKPDAHQQSRADTSRPSSATITSPYGGVAKTRITVKYDVGFGNTLTLRGQGANLSWQKGITMKNIKADEWVWETDVPFATAEFKTLINDKTYETGRNHLLHSGTTVQYSPRF